MIEMVSPFLGERTGRNLGVEPSNHKYPPNSKFEFRNPKQKSEKSEIPETALTRICGGSRRRYSLVIVPQMKVAGVHVRACCRRRAGATNSNFPSLLVGRSLFSSQNPSFRWLHLLRCTLRLWNPMRERIA